MDFGSLVSVTSLKPSVILPDRSRHFLAAAVCLAFKAIEGARETEVVAFFLELLFFAGVFAISTLPIVGFNGEIP